MSRSTASDVSKYEGDGEWFKIYEVGIKTYADNSVGATWVSEGWKSFNFVIPKDIEDGGYLLRADHIAVHSAGSTEGAQFYIGCAQISVTGGTGRKPSPVGRFPGICKWHSLGSTALTNVYVPDTANDPGINFNPYWPPLTNYTMPGLAVYPKK
jgi:hypothetical protein